MYNYGFFDAEVAAMFARQYELLSDPYKTILEYVEKIRTGESTLSHAIARITQLQNSQQDQKWSPQQSQQRADAEKAAAEERLFLVSLMNPPIEEIYRKKIYQALLLLARFFPSNKVAHTLSDPSRSYLSCPLTQGFIDIHSPFVFVAADGTWFSLPTLFEHLKSNMTNPNTNQFFFHEDWQRVQLLQQEQYNIYFHSFFKAGVSSAFCLLLLLMNSGVSVLSLALLSQCGVPFFVGMVFVLGISAFFGDELSNNNTPYVSFFHPFFLDIINTLMGALTIFSLVCLSSLPLSQIILLTSITGMIGGAAGLVLGTLFLRPLLNYLTYPKDPVISKKDELALSALKPVTVDPPSCAGSLGSKVLEGFKRLNLFASCTPHPIKYAPMLAGPPLVPPSR